MPGPRYVQHGHFVIRYVAFCAILYFTCTYYIRMPPKKRKQKDISRQPKDKGRVHIEETYSLDFSAISSNFILLNGHLWYHLLMNGSNINSTTSVLMSLFTKMSNVQDYKIMYNYLVKIDKQYKNMLRGFRVDSHFSAFKEVIKHYFFVFVI